MADKTGIEWTDATWNPIRGCSLVSEGCRNCYAMAVAARFSGSGQPYEGLARRRSNGEPQWTGEVRVIEKHMRDPLRWREPRRVFVNSMSDLFHDNVTDETIAEVFAIMGLAQRHTFQVLTKRPERMRTLLASDEFLDLVDMFVSETACELTDPNDRRTDDLRATAPDVRGDDWPLSNVWLGVSVENQEVAAERIGPLCRTPAAVRFLSCEPLIGPLTFRWALWDDHAPHPRRQRQLPAVERDGKLLAGSVNELDGLRMLDWVIVGGESGPKARPCNVEWIRRVVNECRDARVAVFVKQLGADPRLEGDGDGGAAHMVALRDKKGGNIDEFPADLQIREWPTPIVRAA